MCAAGMLHPLDGRIFLPDAARLTTGIYFALTFLFAGLTARVAWGDLGSAPSLLEKRLGQVGGAQCEPMADRDLRDGRSLRPGQSCKRGREGGRREGPRGHRQRLAGID
jgi:hypothetical protein